MKVHAEFDPFLQHCIHGWKNTLNILGIKTHLFSGSELDDKINSTQMSMWKNRPPLIRRVVNILLFSLLFTTLLYFIIKVEGLKAFFWILKSGTFHSLVDLILVFFYAFASTWQHSKKLVT